MKLRTTYYKQNDLSYNWQLDCARKFLNKEFSINNINDAIEFYNINKYYKDERFASVWTEEFIDNINLKISKFQKEFYIFFNALDNSEIQSNYSNIDYYDYYDSFWEIFDELKFYKKISEKKFIELLNLNQHKISHILLHKNIVNAYQIGIREFLLEYPDSTSILLTLNNNPNKKMFLPDNLTSEDKHKIINEYIASDTPHLNFLEHITNLPEYDANTRYLAQKKYEESVKYFFEKNAAIETNFSCEFKEQEDYARWSGSDFNYSISYDIKWLEGNLDFPTILNNFIFVFEYVEFDFILSLIFKENECGIFEKTHSISDMPNNYPTSQHFKNMQNLTLAQLNLYLDLLENNNIYFEEIISWFFSDYLKDEFGINNFKIKMPARNLDYSEKSSSAVVVFETILKQYRMYIEDRKINHEKLKFDKRGIKYKDTESLLVDKYAYLKEKGKGICQHFFSNQSRIAYLGKFDEKYSTFFELISREKVLYSDFENYQQPIIDVLIEKGFLYKTDNEEVRLNNRESLIILRNIYLHNATNRYYYPNNYKSHFEKLSKNEFIEFESSLLARCEADYFNFYLTDVDFINGLKIRNEYSHGNNNIEADENFHKINYLFILHLLIILIIKINDELCVYEEENRDTNTEII